MDKNKNKTTLSPTPIKSEKVEEGETLLTFAQALELVLLNKKIHKLDWKDREYYGVIDNNILKLHKPDGSLDQWILSKGDIAGTDYVLV